MTKGNLLSLKMPSTEFHRFKFQWIHFPSSLDCSRITEIPFDSICNSVSELNLLALCGYLMCLSLLVNQLDSWTQSSPMRSYLAQLFNVIMSNALHNTSQTATLRDCIGINISQTMHPHIELFPKY